MRKDIAVIILAAGKGERMKSETPKVLHPLCARPMLGYVQDVVKALKAKKCVTVVGYQAQAVRKFLGSSCLSVLQPKLLGTADAVKRAMSKLAGFKGTVVILYGDMPLLKTQTIRSLIDYHTKNNLDATILTAVMNKPDGYGRIIRDKLGNVSGIVEEKDADDYEKAIKEVNTGIMAFKSRALKENLGLIRNNNKKKEFYLTDIVGLLYKKNAFLEAVKVKDPKEAMGINSRSQLAEAAVIMQARINQGIMDSGVTMIDPSTVYVAFGSKIGPDCVIYPFTVIEKDVIIAKRCSIGPFVHVREGTRLNSDVLLGNFVETVRSVIGSGTWAKHFSYMGDSRIGRKVNIGAGTVTANFDGKNKNTTVISDGAFIGSDTVIVAPASIGANALTGAGSVVVRGTRVPKNTVVAGIPARILKKKQG